MKTPNSIMNFKKIIWLFLLVGCERSTPSNEYYLFYIPGGIVLELGGNPVSEYFGKYYYDEIIDTLRARGFEVFSDIFPGTPDSVYVSRISAQIDSLLNVGIPASHISVVGASAGAYITLEIAMHVKNPELRYAILGMCWENTYKKFEGKDLCGRFLSFYEASDPHGPCVRIFEVANCITESQEVQLNMNNSHAFLYRPYDEWVQPLTKWLHALK